MFTDGSSLLVIGSAIYQIPEWAEEEQVPGSTAVRFFGTWGHVYREEVTNITVVTKDGTFLMATVIVMCRHSLVGMRQRTDADTCVSNGDLCCNLWVGASDQDREGMFQWVNNNSLTFTHWFPGEPNGGRNEDCVQLCNNGQWNDESCSNNENALCEKEL
uniref:Mannose-binding protein C n=1 Tax=Magallana gigas TaxID=29159 RepID=K1R943_MAGGI